MRIVIHLEAGPYDRPLLDEKCVHSILAPSAGLLLSRTPYS